MIEDKIAAETAEPIEGEVDNGIEANADDATSTGFTPLVTNLGVTGPGSVNMDLVSPAQDRSSFGAPGMPDASRTHWDRESRGPEEAAAVAAADNLSPEERARLTSEAAAQAQVQAAAQRRK